MQLRREAGHVIGGRICQEALVHEEAVLEAQGEVALFHCNTIHGSGKNVSGRPRFGVINDYTPAGARQSVGTGSGQLVRGHNRGGGFATEKMPVGAFTEDNILSRRSTLMRYPENVLMGPLPPGETPTFADADLQSR